MQNLSNKIVMKAYLATLENGLQEKVINLKDVLDIISEAPQPKTPQEYLKIYSEDEMRPIDLIKMIINDCKN